MKKVISISLALLMLTSHLGFAVGTHFCGGLAVEAKLMIGHEHLDCGMADMDKKCEGKSDGKTYLDKMPCCENEYLSIEVEDEFKPTLEQSTLNFEFVAAFVVSYLDVFSVDEVNPQYTEYDPPLVTEDISTLHQVFII
ncbi:HYC_CC_PP family protein [Ekhidna sp. MALMAid0563]|uniref:HYC_CC_PP family protein n=1 Tax=unclassified Ekhidna TaxID=2632188 RepID=UPI0032DF0396